MSASPNPMTESHLPRAASFTLARSLATWSMCRNAVTGAHSLVSLSIITAMPMPQLGWHPQESWPHSALFGDLFVAAREADGLEAEEADLLGIVEGKFNNSAHLLVVNPVHNGGD